MQLAKPLFFGLAAVLAALLALVPARQDPGTQADVFTGATITTTAQTSVVACGQGDGAIGRKTLVVNNETGGGAVTVTAELRDRAAGSDFTSGYLAVNGLAAGSLSSDTSTPDEAAGRFCNVSAVSASTSTITVSLRKE